MQLMKFMLKQLAHEISIILRSQVLKKQLRLDLAPLKRKVKTNP